MEPRDGDSRKKRKGAAAPPARKRRKAPPSLASPPSVRIAFRMARGARGRRKPTGAAAAPPSLAPPPSVRMARGDGTSRRRRKPTGAAAPPSLAPPPSARVAHGDGVAPPARKRRKGSSLPRAGKRGRRTDPEGGSGRTGSDGGRGGMESSEESDDGSSGRNGSDGGRGGTESSEESDDGTESLAGGEDSRQGLAGRGDDPNPNPNGSGAGGAGHTAPGHPDAPSAPPENAAAARGRISVVHTPNIPPRFQGLLRNITSLIPYEHEGKSYGCSLSRMNTFLKWSKSEMALFFEWSDDEMEMTCWMHNIKKGEHIKFTVNAAFSHEMDDIKVERAAVAFSTNFCGDDEYWSGLKDMLSNMFGSFEEEGLKQYDYLYVFTRVGDSVCFRNFEIISLPKANDPSCQLVLREINTTFYLKPVNDEGTPKSSDIGPHLTKNKTGSCLSYDADFSGANYSFLLENGCYISSLEKLDGFNTSLAEIVVKQSLLKVKPIIGSASNKTYCFARERCKSILQSLFTEFAMLLESGKCMSETGQLSMHNVLVRGTDVRLYGIDLTDYTEDSAKRTVKNLVQMVIECFPIGTIPLDLHELLQELKNNPLDKIKIAKDDCSLLKAEDRRMLLINTYTEYMTNVEGNPFKADHINEINFFDGCPHAEDWNEIMKDNEYMVQVCNVECSDQENESYEERMGKATSSIKKFAKKKKFAKNKGQLQFSSKSNFLIHMPEMARKRR